jgi:long-subunit acyl-CoA synthetase (AMP-forming)
MGCHVVEAFCTSEICGALTMTQLGEHIPMFGPNVGIPVNIEYKLVDYKEYLVTDRPNPRGRLLIRGPVVLNQIDWIVTYF